MNRRKFFSLIPSGFGAFLGARAAIIPIPCRFTGRDGCMYTPEVNPNPLHGDDIYRVSNADIAGMLARLIHQNLQVHVRPPACSREIGHSVTEQCGVDFDIPAHETRRMNIDLWRNRYLDEGAKAVANIIHKHALGRDITTAVGDCPEGVDGLANGRALNLSVRYVRIFDVVLDYYATRFDVYYRVEG